MRSSDVSSLAESKPWPDKRDWIDCQDKEDFDDATPAFGSKWTHFFGAFPGVGVPIVVLATWVYFLF